MNTFIICNSDHRLYPALTDVSVIKEVLLEPKAVEKLKEADLIIDLSLGVHAEKEAILNFLCNVHEKEVVSDMSCHWGEYFHERFPNLKASMSAAFYSPNDTVEVHGELPHLATNFLKEQGLKTLEVSEAGHGFTYPRTVSMIINEAFYAEEDKLASKEDMDTAMLYGVNYPHGLFEWCDKIGARPIVTLLDGLHTVTKNALYRPAPSLRKKAMLEQPL